MTRICMQCGKEFEPPSEWSRIRFCSPECKKQRQKEKVIEHRRKYKHEKIIYQKTCKVCGKVFETNRKNGTMCSAECRRQESIRLNREKSKGKYQDFLVKESKKKKAKEERMKSVIEIDREAKKLGLSYGHYVALKGVGAI